MKPLLTRTNTEDTTRFALVGATAILPDRLLENSYIEFTRGLLTRVGKAPKQLPKGLEVIDVTGKYLAPGWIDIHVHGGAGADFMDGTQQAIETAARAHLKHGTTTMFPTTTTGSQRKVSTYMDPTFSPRNQDAINKQVAVPLNAMNSKATLKLTGSASQHAPLNYPAQTLSTALQTNEDA